MSTVLMTCPHCASELRPGMVRCRDCGKAVNEVPSSSSSSDKLATQVRPRTFADTPAATPTGNSTEPCVKCGELLRAAMIKCPACGFARDLSSRPGSSGQTATVPPRAPSPPSAKPKTVKPPVANAPPALERPSDAGRRKEATKRSTPSAEVERVSRAAPRNGQSAAAPPGPARHRDAARRETQADQEQEDHELTSGDSGVQPLPEREIRPVKPLSWWAMRSLTKTLATKGPDKPDLAEARRKAIQQAVQSNDPRLVPLLIAALEDDWIMVREAAAEALGKLRAEEAIEPLIALVTSESGGDLRRVAGLALSNMADTRAVLPLLKLGLEQPQQRLWVSESISRIGKSALPVLVGCLKNADPGMRLDAIVALGRIRSSEATLPLLQSASDKQPIVRAHVAEALGQIGDPRAVPAIVKLLKDPDSGVRANAANACQRIPDDEELEPLVELLKDESASVRGFAATALGRIADPRAAEPVSRLVRDASEDVRSRVVEALSELEDPRTPMWVLPLLKDEHMSVRLRAVQALGKVGDERAVRPLAAALEDFHEQIRKQAVEALGRIGSLEALPLLISALRRDRSMEVQLAAVRAMGQLGDVEALPALKDTLTSGDFALRCRACVALGEIGSTEAVEALIPLLQDPASEIRYHACVSLGNLGDKRALKPLEELIGERDPFVLRGVGRAFKALGDPRGENLLEQAKQLASTAATARKAEQSIATSVAAAPAAKRERVRAPRDNPLQTLRTVIGSIGEIIAANWNSLDAQRKVTFGAVAGGVVLLAAGTWWFLQPSSNTASVLDAVKRGNVQSVAFVGPETAAVVTSNAYFELWNTTQGTRTSSFEIPGARLVAGSPNGETLAVLYQDGKLEFRNASGTVQATVEGVGNPAGLQFHRESTQLALASLDGTVTFCNVPDGAGKKTTKLEVDKSAQSVGISPDFLWAAYGLLDGQVQLFHLDKGEPYKTIPSKFHNGPVTAIAFARNSPTFATAGANGATYIWNIETRDKLNELLSRSASPVFKMSLSPDGKLLARGFSEGAIAVVDLEKLAVAKSREEVSAASVLMDASELNWSRLDTFAFSSDGQLIIAGNADDLDIGVFDVKTGALVRKLSPL